MSEQRAISIDDLVALNDHWQRRAVKAEAELAYALNQLVKAREALKPFSQTGWMTYEIEHTPRTVVAHMHPEREREIILSSEDFRRARAALTDEMRCDPDEGLPTAEDVRGILAPVISAYQTTKGD